MLAHAVGDGTRTLTTLRRDRDPGDESDARELPDHLYPRRRSEGALFDLCRWGERGDCDDLVKDGGNYCPAHRAASGGDGIGS